jgi:hypothetical protein
MWAIRSAGLLTRSKCFLVYDSIIILLEQIRWVEDILSPALVGIPPSVSVVVKLYVTQLEGDCEKWASDKSTTNSAEKLDTGDTSQDQPTARVLDSPLVSLENGRPHLQNIIQNEIASASGRMSINGTAELITGWGFRLIVFSSACGPHGMANSVRKATRAPRLVDILHGGPTVTLHIESFGLVRVLSKIENCEQELTPINLLQCIVSTRNEGQREWFWNRVFSPAKLRSGTGIYSCFLLTNMSKILLNGH